MYVRIVRATHSVLCFAVWEQEGEAGLFDLQLPTDWTAILLRGSADLTYQRSPPPWIVASPAYDPATRTLRTATPTAFVLAADSRGVLIRAAEADTRILCVLPLERLFLAAAFSPAVADSLIAGRPSGPLYQFLDSWSPPQQVDPRTLVRVVNEHAVVDVLLMQDAALNDAIEALPPAAAPGMVERSGPSADGVQSEGR